MTNSSNMSDASNELEWLDTDIAVVFSILNMIVCLLNEFLLYLHIKMLQRQDLFVEKLLGCYGIFNIVCTPIVAVLLHGVIGLLPISTLVGSWFCDITFFVTYWWDYFNNCFSLCLVCLIYVGLVHERKVNYHGKQFVVNLFCGLSIIIPLIFGLISTATTMHGAPYNFAWAKKCYGIKEDVNGGLCSFDEDLLYPKYGEWSSTIKTCLQVICWIEFSCGTIVLSSNIPEAIFYCMIYACLRRYV